VTQAPDRHMILNATSFKSLLRVLHLKNN